MRPATRDTLTGTVALASLVGLVALLAVFGELSRIGKEYFTFTVKMPHARGLTSTSSVTMNGVRIGALSGLENAADPRQGVDLTIEVEQGTVIPSDFLVMIEKGLISGSGVELLVEPGTDAPPVQAGDVFERDPRGMFSDIQDRVAEIEGKLTGPLETMTSTAEDVGELARTYTELGEKLTTQLDGLTGENGLRTQAEERLAQAGELIEEFTTTATELRATATTVKDEVSRVGALITRFDETVATIGQAAEEVQVLVAGVNAGEGTAGQLAQNPDLYRNLEAASERLDAVLTEAQLLIEKIKAEGVGIHF